MGKDKVGQPGPAVGMAQNLPDQRGPTEGGVLDTSPDRSPYDTDDAQPSYGALELLGGYLYRQQPGSEPVLLNRVIMREMTGKEEDMLASEKVEVYLRFSHILSACLVKIYNDDGVSVETPSMMPDVVDNLTISDRMQMLLYLRMISIERGHLFTFRTNCPKCGSEFRKTVDLRELEQKPMKNPSARIYDVQLSSEKTARCRVLLGKHEREMNKVSQADSYQFSLQIKVRLQEIDGSPANLQDIQNLSLRERNILRKAFDEYEGGVEMSVPHICTRCNVKSSIEVDIGQPDFFFQSGT